ncbi:MAG TPA: RES family NAD+ phosphorylase [Dongiaceae bacterium]|jgi:RES domain-containing protein|nr:RES family NAD+ phosphorylase [Dongiaceae bacterium]
MGSPLEADAGLALPELGFRVARRRYADLSGEGARLVGGRWNSPGRAVLYLAESAALAVLEVLVHLDLDETTMPDDYVIMSVDFSALKASPGWLENGPPVAPSDAECRAIGDAFLAAKRALALRLPSVIVPRASNYVLDPAHPLMAQVTIKSTDPFVFDRRLL